MTADEPPGDGERELATSPEVGAATTPDPDRKQSGDYRPIDGSIHGLEDASPTAGDDPPRAVADPGSRDAGDDGTIQRRFVDGVRGIETPGGDPVSDEMLVDLAVEDGVVTATVDPSEPDPAVVHRVGDRMAGIGLAIDGVDHVRLESAVSRRADDRLSPAGVDAIVAIAGAKGGAGKSTLTVALAARLAATGLDVGIFDADFQAPDVAERVCVEGPLPATSTGNPEPATVAGIQVVGLDLIAGERPVAWRGSMTHDVLEDLLTDAAWQERDVLLVDLPPGVGAVSRRLFQRIAVDGTVLVTTPDDTSLKHAERTAGLLEACDVPVTALVENMAGRGGIHPGDRSVDDVLEAVPGDPRQVTVPFDPALQGNPLASERETTLAPGTEAALSTLSAAVRERREAVTGTVPDDAVDLRGFPDGLQEKRAVLEVAESGDEPLSLAVDAGDVPGLLTAEFGASIGVSDLGGDQRLVRAGGETT